MNKFIQKLRTFMYGRNGTDQLSFAGFILAVILSFINIFVGSYIIYAIELIIMAWCIFRMMSRNIYKRQKENQAFLTVCYKIKSFFLKVARRVKDFPTHVYRKCPHCSATLRLPRRRGKHNVICPRCKNRFSTSVLFGKK